MKYLYRFSYQEMLSQPKKDGPQSFADAAERSGLASCRLKRLPFMRILQNLQACARDALREMTPANDTGTSFWEMVKSLKSFLKSFLESFSVQRASIPNFSS
jgi:hypothetical protein